VVEETVKVTLHVGTTPSGLQLLTKPKLPTRPGVAVKVNVTRLAATRGGQPFCPVAVIVNALLDGRTGPILAGVTVMVAKGKVVVIPLLLKVAPSTVSGTGVVEPSDMVTQISGGKPATLLEEQPVW
jgi:hypothetical protein